jgi:hypothetical protein
MPPPYWPNGSNIGTKVRVLAFWRITASAFLFEQFVGQRIRHSILAQKHNLRSNYLFSSGRFLPARVKSGWSRLKSLVTPTSNRVIRLKPSPGAFHPGLAGLPLLVVENLPVGCRVVGG